MEDTMHSCPGAAAAPRPRALVVDDDAVGRMMLGALLAKSGYAVEEARDGAQGVVRFQAARPAIVFMDLFMPVMDGAEATRRIKRLCHDCFVPVIFVTGSVDEDDLAQCVEAGGDDFLVKPYSQAVLTARIRAMERIVALHRQLGALRSLVKDGMAPAIAGEVIA